MQLQALIFFALVLMEDRVPSDAPPRPFLALAAVLLPSLVALVVQSFAVRRAEAQLDRRDPRGVRSAVFAERIASLVGWIATLGLALGTLAFGWLGAVRGVLGNWPAIDELVAVAPPVVTLAASWWIQEPLERRVRDASLIRRLDEGLPIPAAPTRAEYVYERMCANIFLLLVPLLIVLALGESLVPLLKSRVDPAWADDVAEATMIACAAATYCASPLIARVVLRLRPLPPGELRDDLLEICDRCGVRVSNVFLWDTRNATINGAVMGIVAPLRYVMLTDALLELLPRDELRAVMAHEIGHVRRRHLPWMLGAMVVLLMGASFVVDWPMQVIFERMQADGWGPDEMIAADAWMARAGTLGAGLIALFGFGWLSRRFERQADTFAVQALSQATGELVSPGAVDAMRGALASVARFGGVDPERRSWRHGSIEWRRRYLAGLVGRPVDRLPIDRIVARLKLATAAGLVAAGALLWREMSSEHERYDQPEVVELRPPRGL